MSEPKLYDVVIVGAGIAGSALALALSNQGLSVAIIEAQPIKTDSLVPGDDVSGFDPRVSALTPNSQAFLQHLGSWDGIAAERCCPYRHMKVWDAEGTGRIEFDAAELSVAVLGHIVENRVIVRALLNQVRACKDVALMNPVTVESCKRAESGEISVTLGDGSVCTTSLLVAADGANSRVREAFDFKTRQWDYGHSAIVATVQVRYPHEDTAWQRFLPTGPLAFLPLSDIDSRHFCSIVWSVDEDEVESLMQLGDAKFCLALEQAFESSLGTIEAVSKRFSFVLRQRHAVDYIQPGVVLVGDAAHTIHPLAGQGINLGLSDVSALSEELLRAHRRAIPLGSVEVLQRYQRRRKGENLAMMAAMDGFKRLFSESALPIRWLRNAGMRSVAALTPLKRRLMQQAMGIRQ